MVWVLWIGAVVCDLLFIYHQLYLSSYIQIRAAAKFLYYDQNPVPAPQSSQSHAAPLSEWSSPLSCSQGVPGRQRKEGEKGRREGKETREKHCP